MEIHRLNYSKLETHRNKFLFRNFILLQACWANGGLVERDVSRQLNQSDVVQMLRPVISIKLDESFDWDVGMC